MALTSTKCVISTKTVRSIESKEKNAKLDKETRVSLKNPFNITWPRVGIKGREEIYTELEKHLSFIGEYRRLVATVKHDHYMKHVNDLRFRKKKNEIKKGEVDLLKKVHLENAELRMKYEQRIPVITGVNEVIRLLERSAAQMVFIELTIPNLLGRNILVLCANRQVPVICLNNLSEKMKSILAVSSCLALAFRKDLCKEIPERQTVETNMRNLIDFIQLYVPPFKIDWLDILSVSEKDSEKQADKTSQSCVTKESSLSFNQKVIVCDKAHSVETIALSDGGSSPKRKSASLICEEETPAKKMRVPTKSKAEKLRKGILVPHLKPTVLKSTKCKPSKTKKKEKQKWKK